MAYIVPRVQIDQEFTQAQANEVFPLPAFVFGPQYNLYRYGVAAEKTSTQAVNPDGVSGSNYITTSNITYPYPSQVAGTTPDTSYTEVFIDNLYANYLPNATLGSTSSNQPVAVPLTVASQQYPNRVRFTNGSSTILKTANGFSRSAFLANRDVQVGDYITVSDTTGDSITSKIQALVADTVLDDSSLAATVGTFLASGSDGVTTGSTVFSSSSASFTSALVGTHLWINGKGTYQVISVPSTTTLTLDRAIASGTAQSWHINGIFTDASNIAPAAQNITADPNANYVWTGSGSDPGHSGVTIAHTGTTAYVGYNALRVLSDTYTATVTTGGSLTAARFTVTSANSVFAAQTNVALTGGVLAIDNSGGNVVNWSFSLSSSSLLVAGQSWSVTLTAAVSNALPTAAGTYTGASNIGYKITVTTGGAFYTGSNASTSAQVTVTSDNYDSSPSALVAASTAIPIGNLGVTVQFTTASANGGLIKGDVYYVYANAATQGRVKTVILSDNLTPALLAASTLNASLYLIQNNVQINQIQSLTLNTLNWSATTAGVTVNTGITTTDSNLVSAGSAVALPVSYGQVYIQHRDLVVTNATAISSVTSASQVSAILGTIHPDNPLAQGVYAAALNAGAATTYFVGITSNDLNGYNGALQLAQNSNTVYSFVPLTFDTSVQAAVQGHVDAYSDKTVGRWRIGWFSTQLLTSALLYNTQSNGSNWVGTVTDDPLTTGTNYTLLTVAGATFITDGIRATDQVFLNFRLSPAGSVIWDTYTVSAVRSNTSLVLTTALPSAINIPAKIQINRVYTKDEQAASVAARGASFNDRRIRNVFPDYAISSGVTLPGYHIAAALAGLRASVVPHQGLTNTTVLGFDTLPEVVTGFTQTQLNVIAGAGNWIVTQDVLGATPYVRQQLTTNMSGINTQEDSITTNVDNISYTLQAALAPYIGTWNRNPFSIIAIRDTISATLTDLQTNTFTTRAGNQLISWSIDSLAADPVYLDRLNVQITLGVPYPYNNISVTLVV